VAFIHSKEINSKVILEDFRKGLYQHLICTTILERGVTFSNINVMILNCDHIIFSKETLIQITGRVGRDANFTSGTVIFYAKSKTTAMKVAINEIKKLNGA